MLIVAQVQQLLQKSWFSNPGIWALKKKNLNLYQRVVQMFARSQEQIMKQRGEYHKGTECCLEETTDLLLNREES